MRLVPGQVAGDGKSLAANIDQWIPGKPLVGKQLFLRWFLTCGSLHWVANCEPAIFRLAYEG